MTKFYKACFSFSIQQKNEEGRNCYVNIAHNSHQRTKILMISIERMGRLQTDYRNALWLWCVVGSNHITGSDMAEFGRLHQLCIRAIPQDYLH